MSTVLMSIYRMTHHDFTNVLELNQVIFPGKEPWKDKHFEAIFFYGLCFISRDAAGKMNGYIFAKPNKRGGDIHISQVGVLPEPPRQTIDALLLVCVIKNAQKIYDGNHDRTLTVSVRKDAITTIVLYGQYSFYVSELVTVPEVQMMTRPLYLPKPRESQEPRHKTDSSLAIEYSSRTLFSLADDRTLPHHLDGDAGIKPFSYFSKDRFFSTLAVRRVEGDELAHNTTSLTSAYPS